jgi:hypothetical protein
MIKVQHAVCLTTTHHSPTLGMEPFLLAVLQIQEFL